MEVAAVPGFPMSARSRRKSRHQNGISHFGIEIFLELAYLAVAKEEQEVINIVVLLAVPPASD